jgi:hypothetical protein
MNCVRSVQHNTFEDWQLIIGDSTKEKEIRQEIAELGNQLMKEDNRIIFKQYRAWSEADDERKCNYAWKNNQMFKLATGKYITYHNDDDLYAKDYYRAFLDIFENYPEAKVVYTGQKAYMLREDNNYTTNDIHHVLPAMDIKRCMFFCVDQICVAHDRDILTEVGGWCDDPHVKNYADAEFFYRIWQKGYLAYPTGKFTTIKTVHPGAISQMAIKGEPKNE